MNLDSLVCSNPPCNQADRNSSLANENHVRGFIGCIGSRNGDYANTQCGTPTTNHIFYCSENEDGKFCSELINFNIEIPSACSSRSNCTTECKAVLMERFGCCIHLNFSRHILTFQHIRLSYRLLELQEQCDIPTSDTVTCQLALTPPSDAITQHEFECPDDYSNSIIDYINTYCEIFPEDTQQIVDMSVEDNCSTFLKVIGIYYYIHCDRTGEELCINLYLNYTVLDQVSLTKRQCSTEDPCSPECRKSLISLSDSFGCCANTLLLVPVSNSSSMQLLFDHFYSCSAKTDIWSHCGLSSPGFCDNPLTLNGRPGQTGGSSHVLSNCGSVLMALVPFLLSY